SSGSPASSGPLWSSNGAPGGGATGGGATGPGGATADGGGITGPGMTGADGTTGTGAGGRPGGGCDNPAVAVTAQVSTTTSSSRGALHSMTLSPLAVRLRAQSARGGSIAKPAGRCKT